MLATNNQLSSQSAWYSSDNTRYLMSNFDDQISGFEDCTSDLYSM